VERLPFLSPAWIEAVQQIRADHRHLEPDEATVRTRVNVVVTEAPFDESRIEGYIDTSEGTVMIEVGSLADPELTLEVPYDVARELFVGQDPQAAMQALFAGRIKAYGDTTRLLALPLPTPASAPDPEVVGVLARIRDLTE
jgi:hypothetical protein